MIQVLFFFGTHIVVYIQNRKLFNKFDQNSVTINHNAYV